MRRRQILAQKKPAGAVVAPAKPEKRPLKRKAKPNGDANKHD
jgi:hypothetical protein